MKKILPGSVIGIIGGGQLGQMMAIAAKYMGYKIAVLDLDPEAPAMCLSDYSITAPYNSPHGLKELGELSDVITYEFENIDARSLEEISEGLFIPQGVKTVSITQNRYLEKEKIRELNLPIAPYQLVETPRDLEEATYAIGFPCVLKRIRDGYDGKGQMFIESEEDLTEKKLLIDDLLNKECVLEKKISFSYEASVIGVRGVDGNMVTYPPSINVHRNAILFSSTVGEEKIPMEEEMIRCTKKLLSEMDFYGTIGVEFFVCEDRIYINEIAPRPHNSGHYTIEGCATSQFEQHIRAICGLQMGGIELHGEVVMYNILGQHYESLINYLPLMPDSAHLHLYGKKENRRDRKIGHVTFLNGKEQDKEDFEKAVLKEDK